MTEILPNHVVHQNSPLTPMDLVARALSSGASMETLERMIALQERWEGNEARKAFETAMAEAAKEMPVLSKSADVDFPNKNADGRTQYKYVDLAEVVSIAAPILGKHGLSHRFETNAAPGQQITVTCRISHKQGHSITNSMSAQHDPSGNKNSIQAMGSTITYLSRYTLMAILGLAAAKDDDGQSHREPQARPDAMTSGKPRPTPATGAGAQVASGSAEPTSAPTATATPSPATYVDGYVDGKAAERGDQLAKGDMNMQEVVQFEQAAKNAARQGSAALATFWRNTSTVQERKILAGLKTDLIALRDAADKILMDAADDAAARSANELLEAKEAKERIDPNTGEVLS